MVWSKAPSWLWFSYRRSTYISVKKSYRYILLSLQEGLSGCLLVNPLVRLSLSWKSTNQAEHVTHRASRNRASMQTYHHAIILVIYRRVYSLTITTRNPTLSFKLTLSDVTSRQEEKSKGQLHEGCLTSESLAVMRLCIGQWPSIQYLWYPTWLLILLFLTDFLLL